jgi:hypothetical protein
MYYDLLGVTWHEERSRAALYDGNEPGHGGHGFPVGGKVEKGGVFEK